jgi:hypothetical protein
MKNTSVPCYHARKEWLRDAKGDLIHPKPPQAPEWKPRRAPTQAARLGGYIDTPKDALEILSRMAGGTTFKVPGQGGTGRHVGQDDLPHALGFVKDPLQQRLALALACQTLGEWESIALLAYPVLLAQLRGMMATRDLVRGTKCHRVRLVLRDVMIDRTRSHATPDVPAIMANRDQRGRKLCHPSLTGQYRY